MSVGLVLSSFYFSPDIFSTLLVDMKIGTFLHLKEEIHIIKLDQSMMVLNNETLYMYKDNSGQ